MSVIADSISAIADSIFWQDKMNYGLVAMSADDYNCPAVYVSSLAVCEIRLSLLTGSGVASSLCVISVVVFAILDCIHSNKVLQIESSSAWTLAVYEIRLSLLTVYLPSLTVYESGRTR